MFLNDNRKLFNYDKKYFEMALIIDFKNNISQQCTSLVSDTCQKNSENPRYFDDQPKYY